VDCADGSDEDPALCGGVPVGWTCDSGYSHASDGCDCGCGAYDPDCADTTSASCQYCDDSGSCCADVCPGTVDPNDNAMCL
jgi:hypothetical protein